MAPREPSPDWEPLTALVHRVESHVAAAVQRNRLCTCRRRTGPHAADCGGQLAPAPGCAKLRRRLGADKCRDGRCGRCYPDNPQAYRVADYQGGGDDGR